MRTPFIGGAQAAFEETTSQHYLQLQNSIYQDSYSDCVSALIFQVLVRKLPSKVSDLPFSLGNIVVPFNLLSYHHNDPYMWLIFAALYAVFGGFFNHLYQTAAWLLPNLVMDSSSSSERDYDSLSSHGSHDQGTSSEGSFISDDQDFFSSLDMGIVVQPPERATLGQPLYPPLVIQVNHHSDVHSAHWLSDQASTLMAGWTVLTEDGERLGDEEAGALVGSSKTFTSVYSLLPSDDEREFGFIAFPDITFHEPGSYRLEVFLRQLPQPALCRLVTRTIHADYQFDSVEPCVYIPEPFKGTC